MVMLSPWWRSFSSLGAKKSWTSMATTIAGYLTSTASSISSTRLMVS